MTASRLAFIKGIAIQPKDAPKLQIQTFLPKTRKIFSVHMESNRQHQMAFTLLFGAGKKEARTLPISMVMPMTELTVPITAM